MCAFDRVQAGEGGVAGFGGELAVFDAFAQLPIDVVNGLGSSARTVVKQQHLMAGLRCDLGDPGAHGPGANHADAGIEVECAHG